MKHLATNETSERESDVLNLRCEQEELIDQSLQQSPPVSDPSKTAEKIKRIPEVVGVSPSRQYSPTPASSIIPSNLPVKKAPGSQPSLSKTSTLGKKRRPLSGPKRPQSSVGKSPAIADKSSLHQRGVFHDAEGFHVFGMLDPSAKKKSETLMPERDSVGDEDALATRFCDWAQATLQVALPLDQIFVKRADHWVLGSRPKIRQTFTDGVLLCRIAAAIFEQYGDRLNRGGSDFTRLRLESFSRATNPQSSAHRRRNLELAVAVFKACGVAEEALSCIENLRRLGNQSSPTTIWRVLDAVRHRVELLNQVKVGSQASPQPETKDVNDSAVVAGPSQLQSDSSTANAASSSPKDLPQGRRKQLVTAEFEPAGNLSKAFERLADLPHGQIPSCYLNPATEQAVLIGDRQVGYGILWHLWQCSQEPNLSKPRNVEEGHKSLTQEAAVEASRILRAALPSPLLFDIPAVELTGQGCSPSKADGGILHQVDLHSSFVQRLAWSESLPDGDDSDDLFPVANAPFHVNCALDITPNSTDIETKDDLGKTPDELVEPAFVHPEKDESLIVHELTSDTPTVPGVAKGQTTRIAAATDAACIKAPPSPESERKATRHRKPASIPQPQTRETAVREDLALSREEIDGVVAWLKRLNVRLKDAAAFYKVELMRSIPGISRPPGKQQLSKASALHNIAKGLALLQQKKTMPLHLLRRATAIYTGDREVIVRLLLQIRRAYGHHHVPRRRSGHSQAA
ncbi:hypothetical protein BBJ28_00020293 [Nothophytophthora sp. Chile5]|nr:hypothetical protein BBJ28_00020293 [Nothophytophthora sp. Chile5]